MDINADGHMSTHTKWHLQICGLVWNANRSHNQTWRVGEVIMNWLIESRFDQTKYKKFSHAQTRRTICRSLTLMTALLLNLETLRSRFGSSPEKVCVQVFRKGVLWIPLKATASGSEQCIFYPGFYRSAMLLNGSVAVTQPNASQPDQHSLSLSLPHELIFHSSELDPIKRVRPFSEAAFNPI